MSINISKIVAVSFVSLLGVAIVISAGIYAWQKGHPQQVGCTMEAMLCPDGSSVGRTGPNCEFARCTEQGSPSTNIVFGEEASSLCGPEPPASCQQGMQLGCNLTNKSWGCYPIASEANMVGWKTYRNEKYGFEMQYPENWKFSEEGKGYPTAHLFSISSSHDVGDNSFVWIEPGQIGTNNYPRTLRNTVGKENFTGRPAEVEKYFTESGEQWLRVIKLSPPIAGGINYIYAQTRFINLQEKECGQDFPESECASSMARFKYIGKVDQEEAKIVQQILSTFKFTK